MDANKVIEELQIATGWKNISLVNETIVLKLDLSEMKSVKGLKQGKDCLYLDLNDFDEYPISFVVTASDNVHQYWTLGGQLHRINDLPAYVAFDPVKDRIVRKWYWNGLKHRTTGPAQTLTKGFKVEELSGFPGFYIESWEYMTLEWFQEGFASRFPYCSEAKLENGQRIKNSKTNITESPQDDLPALVVENAVMSWDTFVPSEEFRPVSADIIDLHEIYNAEGTITRRECSSCNFTWRSGSEVFDGNKHQKFNEIFGDELFSAIDLWGPFYKDDQTEFLLISEFNRILDK